MCLFLLNSVLQLISLVVTINYLNALMCFIADFLVSSLCPELSEQNICPRLLLWKIFFCILQNIQFSTAHLLLMAQHKM